MPGRGNKGGQHVMENAIVLLELLPWLDIPLKEGGSGFVNPQNWLFTPHSSKTLAVNSSCCKWGGMGGIDAPSDTLASRDAAGSTMCCQLWGPLRGYIALKRFRSGEVRFCSLLIGKPPWAPWPTRAVWWMESVRQRQSFYKTKSLGCRYS